jgi:hypothetical protein
LVPIANCRKTFFDCHLSFFSLVKAAMNAPRLFKIAQRLSYRHWCNVVNKTPPFLYFSIAKGGTKTIAHLPIVVELSFQR